MRGVNVQHDATHVLLIEADPDDAHLICESVTKANLSAFRLTHLNRFARALSFLEQHSVDVILMNLGIPDGEGLDSLADLSARAPDTPVVVLAERADEKIGVKAIRQGAHDYIVKDQLTQDGVLCRTLRFAVVRNEKFVAQRPLAFVDDVTGLYNRVGILTLGTHLVKLGERGTRGMFLVYVAVNDFKKISDRLGVVESEKLLKKTRDVLSATFRGSDILGRVASDEFAVLGIPGPRESELNVTHRLNSRLAQLNADQHGAELNLTVDLIRFRPKNMASLEDLLAQAAYRMQELRKQQPQSSGIGPTITR